MPHATVATPPIRLLWPLGLTVPPLIFLGFASLALLHGVFFAVLWGVLMWHTPWPFAPISPVPIAVLVLMAAAGGLAFGLLMAAFVRRRAVQLGLPPWERYDRP